ncbi:hypothetical protein K0017_07385 [Staphylococcus massiliensis]|uniref:PH domain-containing protein n=1 Tax=Staphylococcus massiliensis TaxID=555791 RepID=UPI001EE064DF|nr:hypothetical protein [Staphylococcus massiliensis]MCG3402138.1 hypothetical protein [Staphylococcus massiliensis]
MILDKVNPADLFPTEEVVTSVKGVMDYPVQGAVQTFEAAYVATNERLILNVDMAGEFYYRNIPFSDIKAVSSLPNCLVLTFDHGTFSLKDADQSRVESMADYLNKRI